MWIINFITAIVIGMLRVLVWAGGHVSRFLRSRTPRTQLCIAIAAVALLWVATRGLTSKPTPVQASDSGSAAPAAVQSEEFLFDPNAQGADPKWANPLNAKEVQAAAGRVVEVSQSLNRLNARHDRDGKETRRVMSYQGELFRLLANKQIQNPRLGEVWSKFAQGEIGAANGLDQFASIMEFAFTNVMIAQRLNEAQVYLVGGKARVGDKLAIDAADRWAANWHRHFDERERLVAEFDTLYKAHRGIEDPPTPADLFEFRDASSLGSGSGEPNLTQKLDTKEIPALANRAKELIRFSENVWQRRSADGREQRRLVEFKSDLFRFIGVERSINSPLGQVCSQIANNPVAAKNLQDLGSKYDWDPSPRASSDATADQVKRRVGEALTRIQSGGGVVRDKLAIESGERWAANWERYFGYRQKLIAEFEKFHESELGKKFDRR